MCPISTQLICHQLTLYSRARRWGGEWNGKWWAMLTDCIECRCQSRRNLHVMLDLTVSKGGQQNACAGNMVWMCKTWLLYLFKIFDLMMFFKVSIMLKLWFFFSLFSFNSLPPFFLTLHHYSFLSWIWSNNHCKHCLQAGQMQHCTVICKTASRGHCRDSPNCTSPVCVLWIHILSWSDIIGFVCFSTVFNL